MESKKQSVPSEKEEFRLPSSGYDVLIKIIQAYAALPKRPVKLDEVAHSSALERTIVSSNNAFLSSIGLVEGGNLKTLSDSGRSLGVALSHPDVERIASSWREVISGIGFFDKILSAIRIRKGMTRDMLMSHIAITAGKPKSNVVLTGARTIIDILLRAQLVREEDGVIVSDFTPLPVTGEFQPEGAGARLIDNGTHGTRLEGLARAQVRTNRAGLVVSITINVDVTASDLPSILEKIEQFINKQENGNEKE